MTSGEGVPWVSGGCDTAWGQRFRSSPLVERQFQDDHVMVASLPSGTVTMLFSDIEGSTLLLAKLGDRYEQALDAHRSMLRAAWVRWNGQEMGTEGDSFFVVFNVAPNAVSAALQAQRELSGYDWPEGGSVRVRMGVHTGSPAVHGGDYVGMDVHRAARIAGAAHGGQVVVSEATARLTDGSLPDGVRLVDVGSHRLKDLALPERLFQLAGAGLATSFPPLKTLGAMSSLPVPATPLVGRDGELAELTALFHHTGARLVMLTGPGGSGKTRLAVGLAQRLATAFPDGVYFVDLATTTTADAMWSGIAESLGVPVGLRTSPGLFAQLAHRSALVLLDNLEQLSAADTVIAELMRQAPNMVILGTSRRPLHLAGEHDHPVPPLQLPTEKTVEDVERSGAAQLFVQHVGKVRRGFTLTTDNAPDVGEICRRLDGLPLALELAAARARLLSPHALLNRLDSALELRAPGTTDRPSRQHTLRDTIAWSYRLLPPTQQAFFRRLGVFAGGADLEAVAAVAHDLLPASGEPLDLIADLLDASLLSIVDTPDGEPRIRLLETIRSYAGEQLEAHGERSAVQDSHADHYLAVARHLWEQERGPQYLLARTQVDLELDNLRAALSWRLGQLEAGGQSPEQVAICLQATHECTRILDASGNIVESRQGLERAVELAGHNEGPELARCLAALAMSFAFHTDWTEAGEIATRALGLGRQMNDTESQWHALMALSLAHSELGERELARSRIEQAVTLARARGQGWQLTIALTNLSDLEYREGNLGRAMEVLKEALDIAQDRGAIFDALFAEVFLAELQWRHEETPPARRHVFDLVSQVLKFRDPMLTIMLAEICSVVMADRNPVQASHLLGAADAARDRTTLTRWSSERERLDQDMESAKTAMTEEQWKRHYLLGRSLTLEDALTDAVRAAPT